MKKYLEIFRDKLAPVRKEDSRACREQFIRLLKKQSEDVIHKWLEHIHLLQSELLNSVDNYKSTKGKELPATFFVPVDRVRIVPLEESVEEELEEDCTIFIKEELFNMLENFEHIIRQFNPHPEEKDFVSQNTQGHNVDPLSQWIADLDRLGCVVEAEPAISQEEFEEMNHCQELAKKNFYLPDSAEVKMGGSQFQITMGYVRMQAQARIRYALVLNGNTDRTDVNLDEAQSELSLSVKATMADLVDAEYGKGEEHVISEEELEEGDAFLQYARQYYYLSDRGKVHQARGEDITMGEVRRKVVSYVKRKTHWGK